MLAFVVVFLWTYNIQGLGSASPWDVFGMLATVGAAPAISYVLANLTAGFNIFCIDRHWFDVYSKIFLSLYLPAQWYLLIAALKITSIVKPSRKCGNCRICTNACAMGIPLYQKNTVHSGECIECQQCVAACPKGNVSYNLAGSDVRPLVAGTIAAIVIAGIYSTANYAFAATKDDSAISIQADASPEPSSYTNTAPDPLLPSQTSTPASTASPKTQTKLQASSKSSSSGQYADGTYTGIGTGFDRRRNKGFGYHKKRCDYRYRHIILWGRPARLILALLQI